MNLILVNEFITEKVIFSQTLQTLFFRGRYCRFYKIISKQSIASLSSRWDFFLLSKGFFGYTFFGNCIKTIYIYETNFLVTPIIIIRVSLHEFFTRVDIGSVTQFRKQQ